MKAITAIVVLTAGLVRAYTEEDRDLTGCSVQIDGNFYNFGELSIGDDDVKVDGTSMLDYQVQYLKVTEGPNGTAASEERVTINFNICSETILDCSNDASSDSDFANFQANGQQCKHMSGPSLSKVGVDLIDPLSPKKGVNLVYSGGDKCNDTTSYSLKLTLLCDYSAEDPVYELLKTRVPADEECDQKVVAFRSKEACPVFSLGTLWRFFNRNHIIVGLLMLVLGGYLIAFGGKYQEATLFLVGEFTVAAIFLIVLFIGCLPDRQEMWIVWLALVGSLFIGAGAGYATKRWGKAGVLLLGYWIGGVIGSVLYSVLLRLISEEHPTLILCMSVLFFGALVAYLSQVYFHVAVIVGSAVMGSYVFLRGTSEFIGGYPNEFLLYERLQNSQGGVPLSLYYYLIGMFFLALLSVFYQMKSRTLGSFGALIYILSFGSNNPEYQKQEDDEAEKDA